MNYFGRNIDLVVGIYSDNLLTERHCSVLKLYDTPLCAAVSFNHRLASKNEIMIEDLFDETVMLVRQGYMNVFDQVRADFSENYPTVKIDDFPFFNVDVFNKCENNNSVMIVVDEWEKVHPLLRIIPIKWNHNIPMGILHSNNPSSDVKEFLQIISKIYAVQP